MSNNKNKPIEKHNFDVAIRNIDRFSRNLLADPTFDKVEVDGGLFGWGDHKVTGSEMNVFIGKVQDNLISIKSSLRSIVSEFAEVYKAFNYLDGEYINGIISSIKSAELASQQALKAQEDINHTVNNLQKTVVELVKLKERIDDDTSSVRRLEKILYSYRHLDDLDAYWSSIQNNEEKFSAVYLSLNTIEDKLNKNVSKICNNLKSLNSFRTQLESYKYLSSIDLIWSDLNDNKSGLDQLGRQVETFCAEVDDITTHMGKEIMSLKQYRTQLESYVHLSEIDTIWRDLEKNKVDLMQLYEKVSNLIIEFHTFENEVDKHFKDIENKYNSYYETHQKKIKNSYYLGGVALGLIVINFILQFVGVL